MNMTELTSISLPSSIEYMGHDVFVADYSLTKIYCRAVQPPTAGEYPFGEEGNNSAVSPAVPIYVPIGSGDAYRAAPDWDLFDNIIVIPDSEFPESSVETLTVITPTEDTPSYDLQGRIVKEPQPGSLYIRNGKKYIEKG